MAENDFKRGVIEFELENFRNAIPYFANTVLDGGPDLLEALKMRSKCYFEIGRYNEAIDDANQIINSNPELTTGYALRGNAFTKLEQFDDALASFRVGLNINDKDLEITNGLKAMQTEILTTVERNTSKNDPTYDAVKMSSQEPYPGDSELEKLEREIMEKWRIMEFPDVNIQLQDEEKALKEFQAALQYRKAGNDQQALDKLKSALRHDAANFTLRGELATLLYENGDYKEAFQHCYCIPADFRPVKYWKLGGKILNALGLPVHAESWLRQGCRLDKSDEEMPLLFQNIRVQRIYGPLTQGTKVKVVFTQFGRSIQAAENMEKGESLFRDKAAILAQTLDTFDVPACRHCAKNLMHPEDYFEKEMLAKNADMRRLVKKHWPLRERIGCLKCGDTEMYCSEECRDEAWDEYHQVLCCAVNPPVRKLIDICLKYKQLSSQTRCWKGMWNASFSPFVLALIWAKVMCLGNKIAAQNDHKAPTPSDMVMAKSPFRKFIAYGASSNANVIPGMLSLMQEIFYNEHLPETYRYKISTKEFDGRYFQCTCNVQAFSDPRPPYMEFMNNMHNEPMKELMKLQNEKEPAEAMFAGMFPLHACLNHSCDNNVEVIDAHPGVMVKAKRSIKAGEELCTTYISTKMHKRERRAWLFRGYNFWCTCLRCEFEGDSAGKCTQCGKEAKEDGKDKYPGCGKCHRAWYCSVACQKTNWKKGHKRICSTKHSNIASNLDTYLPPDFFKNI